MNKRICIAIAFLFLFPLTASAILIGPEVMKVDYSTPVAAGHHTDYDQALSTYTAGQIINFTSSEVFHVENCPLISPASCNFYTSDGGGVHNSELLGAWAANNRNASINDRLLAVRDTDKSKTDGHNFLVKVAPSPEPATMLLCGAGLVSLAGVIRRRKISAVNSTRSHEHPSSPPLSQMSQHQVITAIA